MTQDIAILSKVATRLKNNPTTPIFFTDLALDLRVREIYIYIINMCVNFGKFRLSTFHIVFKKSDCDRGTDRHTWWSYNAYVFTF